jgi:glycosyltransferase involved in cell wall biosynthesis
MPELRPDISVIVPSYNSRRTIRRTLQSLRDQRNAPPFDVIVVDSSDDGTERLIAREFPEVRLVHLTDRTWQGRARNVGARMARGQVLAFLDADCQACPNWIRTVVESLTGDGPCGVGGSMINANPRSAVSRAMFVLQFWETLRRTVPGAMANHPAANIAYRREPFELAGGYPEDMGSSEETVFHARLTAAGGSLWFNPAMTVTHWNLERWWIFLRHQVKQGRFYRQARRKTRLPGHPALNSLLLTPLFPLYRSTRCLPLLRRQCAGVGSLVVTFMPLLAGYVFYSVGEIVGHLESWRSGERQLARAEQPVTGCGETVGTANR